MTSSEDEDASGGTDINYRLVLLAKQKRDRAEEREKKNNASRRSSTARKTKRKRLPAKRKSSPPRKRSKNSRIPEDEERDTGDAFADSAAEEDDRPEEEIDRDHCSRLDESYSSRDSDDERIDHFYKDAQQEEQSRIDKMIEEKRRGEEEQKDILLEYAHRGLVSGCTIIDREVGYDGAFGDVIAQDPLALKLLKHTVVGSQNSRYYYKMVSSYGLWAYLGMKYVETRPGLLGNMFASFFVEEPAEISTHQDPVVSEQSDTRIEPLQQLSKTVVLNANV